MEGIAVCLKRVPFRRGAVLAATDRLADTTWRGTSLLFWTLPWLLPSPRAEMAVEVILTPFFLSFFFIFAAAAASAATAVER